MRGGANALLHIETVFLVFYYMWQGKDIHKF